MPRVAKGYIEQLPSGSFRVSAYVGTDPITRRQIRLKATVKTEQQAQIELGRLLKDASEGRTPESDATVAKLLDEYAAVAEWDVSTRQTNEGFIRRTIKPALGHLEVRKVRGPILDRDRGGHRRQHALRRPEAARARSRLPPRWVQAARLPSHEGQHDPRHPQHPVWRVRRRAAVGMDRPLGHSGGGATTLRHYADPVPEVDRRAAAYLAKLTARSESQTG
jgi:hypothetical protein